MIGLPLTKIYIQHDPSNAHIGFLSGRKADGC
jgi:hypothetical protein